MTGTTAKMGAARKNKNYGFIKMWIVGNQLDAGSIRLTAVLSSDDYGTSLRERGDLEMTQE